MFGQALGQHFQRCARAGQGGCLGVAGQLQLGVLDDGGLQLLPVLGLDGLQERLGQLPLPGCLRRQQGADVAQAPLGKGFVGDQPGDFFINRLVVFGCGRQAAAGQDLQALAGNIGGRAGTHKRITG